jgi:cytochrome P450
VCWVPVLDGWLVTRRDLVIRVLADPVGFTVDHPGFSTARVIGPSMLSLDGPAHRRHRRAFSGGFRGDRVREAQRGLVDRLAAELLTAVVPRGRVEVRTELAGPLATGVMAAVLGLDVPPQRLGAWYRAIAGSVSRISGGEPPTRAGEAAVAELGRAVVSVLERDAGPGRRGARRGTATAGVLARAAGHPAGLTPRELMSNAAVVLFGGIETTEAISATAVAHLLGHPGWVDRARESPRVVEAAVEESLRLEPAATRVDRYTTADVELGGRRIPAGELVIASLAAANRDPQVWPDPDRYRPGRPSAREHLAFAAGPHACLAPDLARWQAQALIHGLLAQSGLRLDGDGCDPPRGLVFRKPDRVALSWDPPRAGREQP